MEEAIHYDFIFDEQPKQRPREVQLRLRILVLPFASQPC